MVPVLKNLYVTAKSMLRHIYRIMSGADHKTLNYYLLKINQAQDLDSMIYQAARCLYHIFDYRLFACALYDKDYNGGVEMWLDPKTDNLPLVHFIKKDFFPQSLYWNIHYLNNTRYTLTAEQADRIADSTLTFKVMDNGTRVMLYILPRRMMLSYHTRLLNMIVKIVSAALTTLINIKKLENASLIDPLTHCYNRRALDQYMSHDVANAERYGSDLAVIMFDIDYFKQVNDLNGHKAGDAVLQAVAQSVQAAIRKSDYLSRCGGEEFLIVLPGTKFSKAIELAERLRERIERLTIPVGEKTISVTASFGVTPFKQGSTTYSLLQKVDEMLYEAKRMGRNRIKPDLRLYPAAAPSLPRFEGEGSLSP